MTFNDRHQLGVTSRPYQAQYVKTNYEKNKHRLLVSLTHHTAKMFWVWVNSATGKKESRNAFYHYLQIFLIKALH